MKKFVVGLTGGIGSGKSTVAKLFAVKGITVVDADQCARIVVEPGKPALAEIARHFGKQILMTDGSLDRAQLRQRIFQDAAEKKWLESLLHPLIFEEIVQRLENAPSPYAILESPLLIEAGQSLICKRVLVVDVTEGQQIERACKRDNNSRELIESIMKAQASRSQRLDKADDVIDNSSSDPDALEPQISRLHQLYLSLAQGS